MLGPIQFITRKLDKKTEREPKLKHITESETIHIIRTSSKVEYILEIVRP
jgi:hypothetical protein